MPRESRVNGSQYQGLQPEDAPDDRLAGAVDVPALAPPLGHSGGDEINLPGFCRRFRKLLP
jgi:hypothetical protein